MEKCIKVPLGGKRGIGQFATVLASDAHLFENSSWYLANNGYPAARIGDKLVLFHALIFPPKAGKHVDHVDGDKLNNVRSNLRYVSVSLNARNLQSAKKHSQTGELNIMYARGTFRVGFTVQRQWTCIGYFQTLEEAIKQRDFFRARLLQGASREEIIKLKWLIKYKGFKICW